MENPERERTLKPAEEAAKEQEVSYPPKNPDALTPEAAKGGEYEVDLSEPGDTEIEVDK